MLKPLLEKLIARQDLSLHECEQALLESMDQSNRYQIAAFIMLLRAKGETTEELLGFVQALEKRMILVDIAYPVLDIVGTGGDGMHTINISTGSSILAASCGVKIAKHGNRSVS